MTTEAIEALGELGAHIAARQPDAVKSADVTLGELTVFAERDHIVSLTRAAGCGRRSLRRLLDSNVPGHSLNRVSAPGIWLSLCLWSRRSCRGSTVTAGTYLLSPLTFKDDGGLRPLFSFSASKCIMASPSVSTNLSGPTSFNWNKS